MKKAVLLAFLAVAAFAERSGPYAGIGYGLTSYDDGSYLAQSGYSQNLDDSSAGFRIYGGAYMNQYFSVEIDYTDFGDFTARDGGGNHLAEAFTALGVATLLHYPAYNDRIEWFAKIGVADMSWEESGAVARSNNAGAFFYGAGIGYRFLRDWMFKAGYERYSFDMRDVSGHYDWNLGNAYVALEVQF
jgi:hypothetical protein